MEVITILIPLALLLALFFIVGFIWMTVKGQYDDLETPAMRMLLEETNININTDTNKEKK
jgi:cbb3-type cytochrome oxidase maturation protein